MGKQRRKGRKRLPVVLSEAEKEALEAQINTSRPTGLRNRAMLAAMLGAGLRVSEVVALMPRDVDLDRGELRVNDGKGGRDRVVPFKQDTRAWLQAWAEKRKGLGATGRQPVFCSVRGGVNRYGGRYEKAKAITARTAQQMVAKVAEDAGIEKRVTPHVLRHTYATDRLNEGLNIREVQFLLGHASVATTQIYTHVDPVALREKIQAEDEEGGDVQQLARALRGLPADQRKALADTLTEGL